MAHMSHAYPDGCCIYFSFAGSAGGGGAGSSWDAASIASYERAWQDGLAAAEAAGGTIAHHHGVGRSKAPRLRRELGSGIEIVKALKAAFDPHGILNPGNLLPNEPGRSAVTPATEPLEAPRACAPMTLDLVSQLADVPGSTPLLEVEAWLAAQGLTLGALGANVVEASIGAWIADGARGARDAWLDPADHLVAGFVAEFRGGHCVVVRPAPRRSVGPDLMGLVTGAAGRFASLSRVWIRVHDLGAPPTTTAPFRGSRDVPVSEGEEKLLAEVAARLALEAPSHLEAGRLTLLVQ
jgi:alkyldihydroxyacetonephosphate synthase